MTSRLTEKLAGARLIKAFRLEDYAIERLNRNFEQIYQLRMKAVRARGRTGPALEALAGVTIAGVVAFAYWRIAAGISTVGDFMGFVTALLLAAQPIKSLGNVTNSTLEGLAAAERVYELLDEKPNDRRPAGRASARGRVGHGRVRQRRVRLQLGSGRACRQEFLADRAWRQDRGARRPLRRRQVDDHQPGAAALRRRQRPHPHRRAGRARRDARHACASRSPSSARS